MGNDQAIRTPLYGHTSPETAYVVEDYPYGYRLRCKIRYWLEEDAKRGYRFCSQTTNPKRPGEVWNAPKRSTYVLVGACMYLNDEEHVHWSVLTEYSDPEQVAAFVASFPDAACIRYSVRPWVRVKVRLYEDFVAGRRFFTMNGQRIERTEDEQERDRATLAAWQAIVIPEVEA